MRKGAARFQPPNHLPRSANFRPVPPVKNGASRGGLFGGWKRAAPLPAGHDADDFHAVAVGERAQRPLVAAEGEAVVLDEQGGRGEREFGDERGDVARLREVVRLAVEDDFHDARMARSQSFHTASKPRAWSSAAISAGERSSAISNCPVAPASASLSAGASALPRTV